MEEALLETQQQQRLGAIGREAGVAARLFERAPKRGALTGGDVDLVAELAREADPVEPYGHPGQRAGAHMQVRERRGREVDVGAEPTQDGARLRPGQGHRRPLRRDRRDHHIEVGPLALPPLVEPGVDARGAGARRGDHEVPLAEPRDRAVVDDHAVFIEHQAVAAAADLECADVVDIEGVEEARRIRPFDLDLAERRRVEQARAAAHRPHLARDRLVFRLARARIPRRPHPSGGFLEHRAEALVLRVGRQPSPRRVELADLPPGERAERDRRVRRAECGRAHGVGRAARQRGDGQQRVQVAGLALVHRHARGRVALQVLDGIEALAQRKIDVGDGHIVLQVDPLPVPTPGRGDALRIDARARRHLLDRRQRAGSIDDEAGAGRLGLHRARGARETLGDRMRACERPGDRERCRTGDGHEALSLGVEGEATASVRPQVQRRGPTGRGADSVAGEAQSLPRARDRHDLDGGETAAALRARDDRAAVDGHAGGLQRLREPVWRFGPAVDQRRDLDAGTNEIERRQIGGVVVGGEDDAPACGDREALRVGADRAGEHHAGQVVALEHPGLLEGAGREHDAARAHPPVAVPDARRLGRLADPLQQTDMPVVVETESRGGPQQRHPRIGRQCGERLGDPSRSRQAIDRAGPDEKMTAERCVLLDEHDAGARARRKAGCGETRCTAAHHEQVAGGVRHIVTVGIRPVQRIAEAGGAPDDPLVRMPRRPDEGLVVETGRPQRRDEIERAAHIETQARPAVLRAHRETLAHGDERRTCARFEPVALADRDQRVGFLDARAEDAARPMELEAAADEAFAVREQRRGDRVALESAHRPAVPAPLHRSCAIDQTAAAETECAARIAGGHQWATPAAAPSSIRRPCAKRSRPKGSIKGCGRPVASV